MVDTEEEFVSEDEAEGGGAVTIQKLREKLKKAVEEKQEYLEGWQRARADLANYKKEEALLSLGRDARAKAEFAEAIIPTLDTFDMAFMSPSFKDASIEWQKGMQALRQALLDSLGKINIKSFTPEKEKFDPYHHEALREVPTEDLALDQTIESVMRPGYSIGDTIIRPAQVTVYTFSK